MAGKLGIKSLSLFGLLLSAVTAAPVALADSAPSSLRMFSEGNFQAGLWQVTPLDDFSSRRMPKTEALCLTAPAGLLYAGHAPATAGCRHIVVDNGVDQASIAYQCPGRGSGHSSIRRLGRNFFAVDTQGINGREPFALRVEYRRLGDCQR